MYICSYCGEFIGKQFSRYLRHIRFVHSNEPNFAISCTYCDRSFKRFASFRSHLLRKHKEQCNEDNTLPDEDNTLQDEDNHAEILNDSDDDDSDDMDAANADDTSIENITRFIALFVLQTKEVNMVSQQTINSILDSTKTLVGHCLETLSKDVKSCLAENGLNWTQIDGLKEVFDNQVNKYQKALNPVSTEYLQLKYMVEQLHYVQPISVILKQEGKYVMKNGKMKYVLSKETFQYIPILQTLEAILNHPDIITEVCNSHASADGKLRDFCDGEDFKSHPLFGVQSMAGDTLIIHGYYDEFQVTNPLGSRTKNHKLGAFYFILDNIRPEYRSSINLINLFALCKVEYMKAYGIDRILQPFMKDIQSLESEKGLTIKVDGLEKIFHGTIGPFSSDNLGAHMIGGYIESFSSLRICRICMATKQDIQTKFSEDDFQVRTREAHNRHCLLVRDDPNMTKVYGVKRSSALNMSSFFHVVDGLDLDIMHDQLEGVLPLAVKMLLQKHIQMDHLFTLDIVNERIKKFNYGMVDTKNRPSPLKQQILNSNSASISQTATQMWLLIGDLVPEGDKNWENFLNLLHIEEILFAPVTSVPLAAYLSILIKDYLQNFKQLYSRNVIPKQHYMVHYPRQIVRRGPLVRTWAMRFEAKHSYFKKLVETINNFKHIDLSLAKRHQALQAYLLQTSSGRLFKQTVECGPGAKVSVADTEIADFLQNNGQTISPTSVLKVCKWAIVGGTKYVVGCVLITALYHGLNSFGQVDKILFVEGNDVIFQCKKLQIVKFQNHLNAYEVWITDELQFINHKDLVDFHPLGIHEGFGPNSSKNYVILRYRLDCI